MQTMQQGASHPGSRHASSGHVLVIGAGLVGAMTAFTLSRAGYRVTVVEKHTPGRGGSTCRSAACSRQQFDTEANVIATRYSTAFFEEFRTLVGGSQDVIVQNGYVYPYTDAKKFACAKEAFELQRRLGLEEVELFASASALLERFPELHPEGLLGGTFCRTDGFLRPVEITDAAIAAAKSFGATVLSWTNVTRAEVRDSAIVAVHAQMKSGSIVDIEPNVVVNCGGPWADRIARIFGTSIPVVPWKRYLTILGNPNGLDPEFLASRPMYVLESGAYCHPEGDHQFCLGWAAKPDQPSPRDFSDNYQDEIEKGFHPGEFDSYPFHMIGELASRMPFLSQFRAIAGVTSGLYDRTPDDRQFVGWDLRVRNLIHAAGFSGHGLMCGPFTSESVRQLIEGGRDIPEFVVDIRGQEFRVSTRDFAVDRDYSVREGAVI